MLGIKQPEMFLYTLTLEKDFHCVTVFSPKDGYVSHLQKCLCLYTGGQNPSESHFGLKAWKEGGLHYEVLIMFGC